MYLSFKPYAKKCDSLTHIFDLLRHALNELKDGGFRRYMKGARKPREATLEKTLAFLATIPDGQTIVPDLKRHHKRNLSSELPITPNIRWAEYKGHSLLGLNTSELISRVAIFEAFMKDVHEHALKAKPELLARVKPNRPVLMKDLFRTGFERFKAEEISRQVREADRLRTKDRVKFFQKHLHLGWGDASAINRLAELIELRHEIVHKEATYPVTDAQIADARKLFFDVSRKCFDKACEIYPATFKQK